MKVSGPAKVKKGKKAIYKVRMTNSGNAQATGVRLVVSVRGIRFNAPVGRINATFKVVSKNAGTRTVRKKITVRR